MLTELFYRVGLRISVRKTVGMVCRTWQVAGVQVDKAYTRRMTGEGIIFTEYQREQVL